MIYLVILGVIALFAVGVFVGTQINAAKLKAVEAELKSFGLVMSSDARNLAAAIRRHL